MGNIIIDKVSAGEFEMKYCRFGSGDRTFVILPGLSVQSVMGSAQAVAEEYAVMCRDFTVYLFDRREKLPRNYSVHDMAEDTVLAVNALGLEDICLFGASQGGMMALDIAIHHPSLVRKLALGSAASDAATANASLFDKWISLAQSGDRVGLYLAFCEAIYPAEIFAGYRETFAAAAGSVTDAELERFVTLALGTKGFDVTGRLREIKCPVLALASADDKVLGADSTGKIIGELGGRTDFSYHIYNGFGHASFDTAPDYRQRLYEFFTR